MNTPSKELLEWLETVPTTEETLAELSRMDIPDLEKDPEFVADTLKGMVTEDLLHAMAEQGLNRNQLAQKMGKSRQYIGRVLNESANFTLERLAEFACALNRKIEIRICHRDIPNWSRPGKDEEDVSEQTSETILKDDLPSGCALGAKNSRVNEA